MLRLQDFDQSALFSAVGQGNSLSCGSTGRFSLDLGLLGKPGLSLKVKEKHSTLPNPALLNFYTGKIQGGQHGHDPPGCNPLSILPSRHLCCGHSCLKESAP